MGDYPMRPTRLPGRTELTTAHCGGTSPLRGLISARSPVAAAWHCGRGFLAVREPGAPSGRSKNRRAERAERGEPVSENADLPVAVDTGPSSSRTRVKVLLSYALSFVPMILLGIAAAGA